MSEEKGAKSETKAVADQFLGTLGLVDIVLGSLVIYWARVRMGDELVRKFPSTGIETADFLLMLTTAALAGKMIELVALVQVAVIRTIAMIFERYRAPVAKALGTRSAISGSELDLAEAYILFHKPNHHRELQQIRTQAILALGAALVSVAFAYHFWTQTAALGGFILAAAFIFFMLGVLQSLDFVGQLGRIAELIASAPMAQVGHGTTQQPPRREDGCRCKAHAAPEARPDVEQSRTGTTDEEASKLPPVGDLEDDGSTKKDGKA